MKKFIYKVVTSSGSGEYITAVNIDDAVIEEGYTYAYIERRVTGENNVEVIDPQYYKGYIDDEVYVTIDDDGEIVIKEVERKRSKNQDLLAKVLAGKNWVQAPQMPALTADSTSADAMFAGLSEYIVEDGLAAMKYSDVDGNERKLVVIYEEHSVAVFRVNSSGAVKMGTLRNKDLLAGRHKINLVHGCIHVNELVVRINNISNGIIDSYEQEYNHHTPVSMAAESFGPDAGSMSDPSHNRGDHSNLCKRLHDEVGIIPHVKSYYGTVNNVYSLLGLNRPITPADLVQFNPRVVNGIYYFD